jgi:glyoxylase-like metal-dependent hydrolase (beta-lactamase superfamily II)
VIAERFESTLWKTSSLLIAARGEAVLVDPGISTEEVARISDRADELGVSVTHVLATHADWDHVCGIAAFPDAVVTMSELAAARVVSRYSDEGVAKRAAAHDMRIAGEPRVDQTFEPGVALQVGPFLVETLALPGHTPDGVAYRFTELDLLVVGDHLSAVEFPFATSTAAYRATLAALIELLQRDPPTRVVPGHGPELSVAEALAIAQADLDYLWALHRAVRNAAARDEARTAALKVPVPRAAAEGLEEAGTENVTHVVIAATAADTCPRVQPPMKDPEGDALLAELELAWLELRRVERESRTYLVRNGVLDQTRLDLIVALRRMVSGAEGEDP